MGHLLEGGAQIADLDRVAGRVLLELEGVLDQVVVAPGADHLAEDVAVAPGGTIRRGRAVGPLPDVDRDRLLLGRVGQRVGVGDEVEPVVGVQVREDDRVEVDVVEVQPQLREDAVAAVEQHVDRIRLDQVAAAGSPGVLPGRRLAEDRHSQPLTLGPTLSRACGFCCNHPRAGEAAFRFMPPGRSADRRSDREAAGRSGAAVRGPPGCPAGRSGTESRGRERKACGGERSSPSHVGCLFLFAIPPA